MDINLKVKSVQHEEELDMKPLELRAKRREVLMEINDNKQKERNDLPTICKSLSRWLDEFWTKCGKT